MDICRLCLLPGSQNVLNPKEIFNILKIYLPSMNPCLKHSVFQLCETCMCNINTLKNLNNALNKTEEKIETRIKKSNVEKLHLIHLLETKNGTGTRTKNIYLCRICLQIIHCPKVFLYANDTNVLRYDLIYSMFLFCNIKLKCDISPQPMMCLQCWENIQICYSFKKNYIETNNKIEAYLTQFNISKNAMNEEVLKKISLYISTETNETIRDNKELCVDNEDIKGYSLRRNVKKEYLNGIPRLKRIKEDTADIETGCNSVSLHKRTRYKFTAEDDQFLLEFYYECTNGVSNIGTRPWKDILKKWLNKFPEKPLKISSIHSRLTSLLKQKQNMNIPQKCSSKTKPAVNKVSVDNKAVNIFGQTPLPDDTNVESDDSFVAEVTPVSFMPSINSEPLSDDEVYVIEAKMEHFADIPPSESDSDLESLPLPLLERMDLPEMWKVDHNSVDSKRETMERIAQNKNIAIQDTKSYTRVKMKGDEHDKKIYKCTKCNFETKYQYSADRHANWHADPNKKGFKCSKCYFITTKNFLLKQHFTDNHQDEKDDDDDLPVLLPFITY